jgi:hypothetical protein
VGKESDFLLKPWYVVPNDVIGGWSIASVDKPVSALLPHAREFEIMDCLDKSTAQHIVTMHNESLLRS